MRIHHVIGTLAILALVTLATPSNGQDGKITRKPVSELPEIKELPDPFKFMDGSPVKNAKDWERRRVEIKELFQEYVYGHMPPKPKKMTVKKGTRITDDANKVITQMLEVTMEHEGKSFTLNVTVALPAEAKGKVPVLIQAGGFGGKGGKAAGAGRFKTYTDRGYAVAEFNWNAVAVDNKRTGGIFVLFGDKIDTSTLMGWAWGISRVIDALEDAVPEVDTTKVFITGHSRNGKATIVAGAFDERIALTVPSHSGTGGIPPFRFVDDFVKRGGQKVEKLDGMMNSFPNWYHPKIKEFAGKTERLPVDQHLLAALVAPRALMNTEGLKDFWINPEGAQVSNLAAKRVYKFLGAEDKISFRYRDVGHIPSTPDMLEFADHIFFGKKLSAEFGKNAYKDDFKAYEWDAPK